MFRNNHIAEFKNEFHYLKVENKFKEDSLKIIHEGKSKVDILEGSDAFYIGESDSMRLQQMQNTLSLLGIPSELFKKAEPYTDGLLVGKMD